MKEKKEIKISFRTALELVIAIETAIIIICIGALIFEGQKNKKEIEAMQIEWKRQLDEFKQNREEVTVQSIETKIENN